MGSYRTSPVPPLRGLRRDHYVPPPRLQHPRHLPQHAIRVGLGRVATQECVQGALVKDACV